MQGISGKAANFGTPENKKKFNDGTELNTDFDINFYETEFRSYDPQFGRFGQIDPVEGISMSFSLYNFTSNNPIRYNDPLGLWTDSIKTKDGSFAYSNNPNLTPVTVKPPRKSKPFGGFHFPKTQKNQSKWNDEMYARQRDGRALHQPGDPEWLADQSDFHKRNFQAGQDHRKMSIGALVMMASPVLLASSAGTVGGNAIIQSFTFKIQRSVAGGVADLVNQKLILGKSWGDVNFSTVFTNSFFGGRNLIGSSIFESTGSFINLSGNNIGVNFSSESAKDFLYGVGGNLFANGSVEFLKFGGGIKDPIKFISSDYAQMQALSFPFELFGNLISNH